MKKLYAIFSVITMLPCCSFLGNNNIINQQCNFAESVCTDNLQALQDGITKFYATGGMYIIKDMDSGETLEITSINFDLDMVYEVYFSKIDFEKKTAPKRLLNKYINLVKTSGKGLHQKLRDNVTGGTGRRANVENAEVFGITATTKKSTGMYVITTFLGHFRYNGKSYAYVFVMDEPKGIKSTYGWKDAGLNIVPTAGSIIENIVK